MLSESDKCNLSKDVSSVASIAAVLFPEKTEMSKVYNYLSIGISLIFEFKYRYRCIGFKLCVLVHH